MSPANTEKDAVATYEEIKAMPAVITADQMKTIEAAHQSDPHGFARRSALAVLSQPCADIFEKIETDRETAVAVAAMLSCVDNLLTHIDAYREMISAAQTRLMVGLCARDDMEAVLAEGEASCE